ncbi:MAG TPA: AsmA family protein, partial [Chloroflexia bacterium]|nr:AsmA family protein [Chloroflexia bacterium]
MFGFMFRLVGRVIGFAFKAAVFGVAIVAVGAGTMYALFDADQYKRVITQRLVDVTGRTVSINGPAELELTLPPRIVLNDVRIGNARWGTRRDMARIRRMEMRVNPLRAIAGDGGSTDVRLAGVDLYLETGPAGVGNWEFGEIISAAGMAGVTGAMVLLDSLGLLLPGSPS